MTEKARGTSKSELAEFYDRTHSVSEFDESAAYPVEVPSERDDLRAVLRPGDRGAGALRQSGRA